MTDDLREEIAEKCSGDPNLLPDSARYRMAGNGVVAPVAEWIAYRIFPTRMLGVIDDR